MIHMHRKETFTTPHHIPTIKQIPSTHSLFAPDKVFTTEFVWKKNKSAKILTSFKNEHVKIEGRLEEFGLK